MVRLPRCHATASNPISSLPPSHHPHHKLPRHPHPPQPIKNFPNIPQKTQQIRAIIPPNKNTHLSQHHNQPMTTHPQTQPLQRQKKTTARPTSHPHPTAMTLPPVTAEDAHRKAPASTTNRPPAPKNRCKIVTKSGQKKNYRPLLPDFSAIPAISAIFPPKHVPPFHHPYNSCPSLISPRMHPNPTTQPQKKENPTTYHYLSLLTTTYHDLSRPNRPKKENPPSKSVEIRHTPSKPVPPHVPPTPKFVHNPHPSCTLPPSPPTSVIQFTRTVPYKTLQPFSPAQE